jgi:hypothetical protein
LTLRALGKGPAEIESEVRRWFVMAMLTGRYSGSPETAFDYDIRQIDQRNLENYANTVFKGELSDAFWNTTLPQEMDTSSASSPYFRVFLAALVKMNDKGFLSRDITARDLILNKRDMHHVFPKNYLKEQGLTKGRYNQIANFTLTQTEINIAIGDKAPSFYFGELVNQCNGGRKKYGGITDLKELKTNLRAHCIPDAMLDYATDDYDAFLEERKIKQYFESL